MAVQVAKCRHENAVFVVAVFRRNTDLQGYDFAGLDLQTYRVAPAGVGEHMSCVETGHI